jgi:phosphoribosylformimino-5-aminoimidazole carboxamide ribotide isomerase
VIDLKGGLAMRAAGGRRADYKPIASPLASSADPAAVVEGFLGLHPFDIIYIADLDAIEDRRIQVSAIQRVQRLFPELALWVDCGIRSADDMRQFAHCLGARPVLGSETLRDLDLLRWPGAILSLDFKLGQALGDGRLHSDAALWPECVIVMVLDNVGGTGGPDFTQFERLVRMAARKDEDGGVRPSLYSAGGIRGLVDLVELERAGAQGALVASALHSGALSKKDLAALARKQTGA